MRRTVLLFYCMIICVMTNGQEKKSLQKEIVSIMNRYEAIGLSVVVFHEKQIIYSGFFGNRVFGGEESSTIGPQSVFWLASVSKTFIGTAIMQLVEKGKLSLDSDINDYLDFPVRNPSYKDTPITVRMLLSHRSSLNDSHYGWSSNPLETDNEIRYSSNFNKYPPGSSYYYCNLGYSLLGAIIEFVSGKRFDEYIDENINKRLRLKGSFNLTKIDSSNLVISYDYNPKKNRFVEAKSIHDYSYVEKVLLEYRLGHSTGRLSPAGGMRMSANDLATFLMAIMNGGKLGWRRVLRPESITEMCSPQGPDKNYGLSLTTYTTILSGHKLIGMRGGSHGVFSIMVFDPEERIGYVLITNGYNTTKENGSDMNYRLIRTIYKWMKKDVQP